VKITSTRKQVFVPVKISFALFALLMWRISCNFDLGRASHFILFFSFSNSGYL